MPTDYIKNFILYLVIVVTTKTLNWKLYFNPFLIVCHTLLILFSQTTSCNNWKRNLRPFISECLRQCQTNGIYWQFSMYMPTKEYKSGCKRREHLLNEAITHLTVEYIDCFLSWGMAHAHQFNLKFIPLNFNSKV